MYERDRKKGRAWLAIKRGPRWLDHRLVLRLVQSLAFQVFKSLFYTCLLSDLAVITRDILGFFLHTLPSLPPPMYLRALRPVPPFFLHLYSARPSNSTVNESDEGSGICNVILRRNERHVPRAYHFPRSTREKEKKAEEKKGERCRRTLRSLFKSAREDQFVEFREYF